MTARLLIASSPQWGYAVPAIAALRHLRGLDWASATLLHRDRVGVEQAAGRWWRVEGGPAERVADAVAAVERALMVVAFVAHRDPEPMAVLDRAAEVGVPVWLHYLGRYPYPVGSAQFRGEHPAQVAARAAEQRAAATSRAAAVAKARAAARGRRVA